MAGKRNTSRKPRATSEAPEKKVAAPDSASMASTFRLVTAMNDTVVAGNTHHIRRSAIINPPPGPGRDRTKPDRDRFRDKIRKGVKDRLKDIVKNNPIFGDKGKVKVPVEPGKFHLCARRLENHRFGDLRKPHALHEFAVQARLSFHVRHGDVVHAYRRRAVLPAQRHRPAADAAERGPHQPRPVPDRLHHGADGRDGLSRGHRAADGE